MEGEEELYSNRELSDNIVNDIVIEESSTQRKRRDNCLVYQGVSNV